MKDSIRAAFRAGEVKSTVGAVGQLQDTCRTGSAQVRYATFGDTPLQLRGDWQDDLL